MADGTAEQLELWERISEQLQIIIRQLALLGKIAGEGKWDSRFTVAMMEKLAETPQEPARPPVRRPGRRGTI